jgi:oligoendopeptidase F
MIFDERKMLEYSPNAGEAKELPQRKEIQEKYKWDLTHIYKNDEEWEKDFRYLTENMDKLLRYEGKLGRSAKDLLECLKTEEELGIIAGKLFLFAMLSKDLDLSDAEAYGRYDRTVNIHALLAEKSSFIVPEIQQISRDTLERFLEEEPKLKIYAHYFENIRRMAPHTLDKEKEKLLAMTSPLQSIPYDVFSLLENADLEFPEIEGEDGKPVRLSHGRYQSALFSSNREYRQRAYKAYYKPFIRHKNTLAALFVGNLKASSFEAKARLYPDTLTAALFPNNIPVEVYEKLIASVNENLSPLHRWAVLKKKILKIDELHPYDSYVTLFPASVKEYSYEQGIEIVLRALQPLGEEYITLLKKAFDQRWLDVFETRNKRSGAYSSGATYGTHPYVLLNWNGNLNDVFTLAHEMGHCLHSYYTVENQPYPYADYTIFLAEVASITNETLLLSYLLDNADSSTEKLFLMEKYLLNTVTTFYRQTRFAEFEKLQHGKFEKGEAITPETLCRDYGELYLKYWGKAMVMDEEETYTWARVPHFYYNFYVYQYATGFAAAQTLARKILTEGKTAAENYLGFLKAGSSKYSIEILKDAGVDMSTDEPVLAVTRQMQTILNEMENLLKAN